MELIDTIKQLPNSAGIYQYFDKNGRLLYIGKAKNLKKRVKSYFSFTPTLKANTNLSNRIKRMIEQTATMNYIVVNSEHDALILENSLIKQLNPKYNILLRDDKTYPYIYIDTSQKYPRFEITRKIIDAQNIKYFGPYSVGARDILDSIYEICKLIQKKGSIKNKKKCLYYQIGKCLAPCEINIPRQKYDKEVQLAIKLIQNKNLLLKELQSRMEFYAQELRFEEAAQLRDRCEKIARSQIKSDIDFATNDNFDIFALHKSDKRAVMVKIFMRDGKIISSTHNFIPLDDEYDSSEFYERAIIEFYSQNKPPITPPILIAHYFENAPLVENYLSQTFDKKITISLPQRGKKKQLINLAVLNAKELLKRDEQTENFEIQEQIKTLLSLQKTPIRVEIFDNSHMSGVASVGAMVVYNGSKFDKKSYRTYHLDSKDEYSQMKELLTKRIQSFHKNPPPDLWIIDGGATLLNLATEILLSNGIFLDVIAISKEKIDAKAHRAKGKANDIIHTKDNTFKLKNSDKRLQWVQNLRDEAHKSAINFHKKTKLKLDKESKLLSLNGISEAKIKKLLKYFGTFEALKKVTLEEISSILNLKDAKTIKNIYF